jgi:hypothetical protein
VDRAKRDALARLLLENVTSTSAGEKLDEKLAALTLHPSANDCACSILCLGVPRSDGISSAATQFGRPCMVGWSRCASHTHHADLFLTCQYSNLSNLDPVDHPNGVFIVTEAEEARYRSINPFDSPTDSPLSSSPSLSDEELFTAALQDPLTPAQVAVPAIVRKPPPLPSRARKPSYCRWMFYDLYGVSCT